MPAPPATEKLSLHNVAEDVILLILAECDIASVIAVSETSKYLHHLAFERNVWFSLVSRLVQRRFIDSQPDNGYLKDLSTDQLIDLVKRLLRGPKTWSPHSAPVESRRIVLHPEMPVVPVRGNKAKLLPGGRYVLFLNWKILECWSVFEDKLVWTHTSSIDLAWVIEFDAELVEDDQAVIVICQRTWTDSRNTLIEISTLDLKSGVSSLKLVTRAVDSEADNPYTDCTLCRDVAAIYLHRARQVLLINWRTRSRVVLLMTETAGGRSYNNCQIAIVPDYLVLTLPDSKHDSRTDDDGSESDEPQPHQLALCPFVSFVSWEPADSENEPSLHVAVADLPICSACLIPLQGCPPRDRSLWVFESPLQRGCFKVWLYTYDEDESHGLLCNYDLDTKHPDDTRGPAWRKASTIPISHKIKPVRMSLSGHSIGWQYVIAGIALFPPAPLAYEDIQSLQFTRRVDDPHLSPFSGAVTWATSKELVIVYYE